MKNKGGFFRIFICLTLLLVINLCSAYRCQAQDVNYKAYSIYVYNFMKYIEWPGNSKTGEFSIGVIGDSPVIKELEVLAASKKVNGRKIVIKKFKSVEEADYCEILYLSSSKSSGLKKALEKTKGLPTLLIAEREGLARKGAGINFITLDDDTLKFELNKKEIESHNLRIAVALLSLGIVI